MKSQNGLFETSLAHKKYKQPEKTPPVSVSLAGRVPEGVVQTFHLSSHKRGTAAVHADLSLSAFRYDANLATAKHCRVSWRNTYNLHIHIGRCPQYVSMADLPSPPSPRASYSYHNKQCFFLITTRCGVKYLAFRSCACEQRIYNSVCFRDEKI